MSSSPIEAAIYYRLANTAAVTALVAVGSIKPIYMVQGLAAPYIVYSCDRGFEHQISGRSVDLGTATVTIEIATDSATGYADAKAIASAVRDTLDGFVGTMGSGGSAVDVQTCILESQVDASQLNIGGGDARTFIQVLSFSVGFTESVPTPS